jgi:hypothetical protein
MKASVEADKIVIVGPVQDKGFLDSREGWLKVLETQKEVFNTEKLATTLEKMCTKLNKRTRTKTTNINLGLNKDGEPQFELSNEVFNDGMDPGLLRMLPIPYTLEQNIDGKDQEVTRVFCLWRAYVVGTKEDIKEENKKKSSTSDYNLMVQLMAGTKIKP